MKILRFLLFPFAILYDLIISIRNFLFDVNILRSISFDIPVIAVGNLSVGGTGKSPQIEYLIRLLKNEHKVAVLSRGYKRKTKGFQLVNSTHSAEDVGDEPLQFFKKFDNVTVAVDANRTNGIQQLLKLVDPPEIILLDDAFQHRKVKAGFYILLTKYDDLYVNDFILPAGHLRESRKGAKRANIVVVTKCPQNLSDTEQNKIIKKLNLKSNQKVFFTAIDYDKKLKGSGEISIENLKNKEIVLVTGIANPTPLLNYLSEENINFTHLKFPDHHNFTSEDISRIHTVFNGIESEEKILITTEKDYVRLKDKVANISYIAIKSIFLTDEKLFVFEIQEFIKK
ncbi:tetraacyldisaccharide 4'-kinase [Tenacibaculum adriaticum]|nr:tetraacyldisaccharide 4'-kinase [Tenacibaculum adriaticum]